jgi:hypothetical protein
MPLTDTVIAYCERTDATFWAEPLNAITNAAFIAGAWALRRELSQRREVRWPASVASLPALVGLVGACSFLFHTLATVWARLADQLSILLFACVFLYAFLRHVAGTPAAIALAAALVYSAASYAAPMLLPAGLLNQSGAYFPYLAALLAMTAWLHTRAPHAWKMFAGATGLFCVALAARTLDLQLCRLLPLGTHFVWHLLNAVVMFLLSREVALQTAAPVDASFRRRDSAGHRSAGLS